MKTFLVFLLFFVKFSISKPVIEDGTIVFRDENENESNEVLSPDGKGIEAEIVNIKLESGQFFQGDIVLSPEQEDLLALNSTGTDDDLQSRTGILLENQRWPKNTLGFVIMPFRILATDYTTNQQNIIQRAMSEIEKYTCVRFIKRTIEKDFVEIRSGTGCHSNLGKIGKKQEVSLRNDGCMKNGIVQHELIHALGYDHMHSHIDRDQFVDVKWENIKPEAMNNFGKVNPKIFGNFNTDYDLLSVMHYPKGAFSKNGKPTIVARSPMKALLMGQRAGMSGGDVKRINNMYECNRQNIG